jgi:hypothetical protein
LLLILSDVPKKGVWIALHSVVAASRGGSDGKAGRPNLLLASVAQWKVLAIKIDIGFERVSGRVVSLFDG